MKTSSLGIEDMLSVLSVDDVERRIGEVPGVESVTVNFAARTATVRYDETRLGIPDIKSSVRQLGYEAEAPAATASDDPHRGHGGPSTPPASPPPAAADTSVAAAAPPAPTPAAPQSTPGAVAAAPASHDKPDKATPEKT